MEGPEFEISELEELERVVADATAKPKRLAFSLLKSLTNDFSQEGMIGCGGYSDVYKASLPSGLCFAVKKMRVFGSVVNQFEDEVLNLTKATHKNVLRFIGYCSHTELGFVKYDGRQVMAREEYKLICTEYLPNGILDKYITDELHKGLEWNRRYEILKGICLALSYLHDEVRIIHGDIKPGNVLLDVNFVPKLFDFGLSMCLGEGIEDMMTDNIIGTYGYMAPELIQIGRLSFKADIYGLGIMIIELLTGSKGNQSVEQVLENLRKGSVKAGAFSTWENKYHQVRTCLEIGYNCIDIDPNKRPTALKIIQLLDETESTNYSVSGGHAPPSWTSGDEESDLSDTYTMIEPEPESTAEFPPSDEELADLDTEGETSAQEHDKPDALDLSKLKFLAEITDEFSYKRIVGKDGTFTGSHKAFVYKGDIPHRTIVAVKRLINFEVPVEKFKRELEQFMSLDHKNIVKVAGYCHDKSGGKKLVQFKGEPLPRVFNGPEQLICYEYVHNGSLREYLAGQGSREIDWHMRYKLIKGTCEGLHYLHKGRGGSPIVHLNLSPSNVLLGENKVPRITGFDFSKLIGEKNTKSMVLKLNGPIAYLPPDFFHSKGTDLKYLATVDIYSLGLMILEMATRQEIKGNHEKLIESIEKKWVKQSQVASLYTSLEADKLSRVELCITIGLDIVKSSPGNRVTAGDILLWLDTGSKPVPVPRARAGGVPRPPVRTNITQANDHIQEKEKQKGFLQRWGVR